MIGSSAKTLLSRQSPVAGEDDGLPVFVALAYDLEQDPCMRGIEREVADLVDGEQLRPRQIFHFSVEFIFGQGDGPLPGHIFGGREVDPVQLAENAGSIDILRRYLDTLAAPLKAASKLTVRYETPLGQQAQADWTHCGKFTDASGRLVSIYAFVSVLSFSRMIFERFTLSMKLSF